MKRSRRLPAGAALVCFLIASTLYLQRTRTAHESSDLRNLIDSSLIQPLPASAADRSPWTLLIQAGQELNPGEMVFPLQPILSNYGNWRAYRPFEMNEINKITGKSDILAIALRAAGADRLPMARKLEPNPKELAMLGATLDLLAVHSHQTCIVGKPAECSDELARVARVYSLCERSPAYAPYLVKLRNSFSKQSIVFQAALHDQDFEEAQLKQMLDALEPFGSIDIGLVDAIKAEFTDLQLGFCTDYRQFEQEKHAWGRGIPEIQLEGGNWAPDQSALALNDWVKEEVTNLESGEIRSTAAWDKLQEYIQPVLYQSSSTQPSTAPTLMDNYDALRHKKKLRLVPNSLGRVALQFSTVHQDLRFWESVRHRSEWEALRLSLALRAYEKKHGELPPTLADLLSSGIIDKLPNDPMNGKPFLYDLAKRLVWGVGDNNRDEGGPPYDPGLKIPSVR